MGIYSKDQNENKQMPYHCMCKNKAHVHVFVNLQCPYEEGDPSEFDKNFFQTVEGLSQTFSIKEINAALVPFIPLKLQSKKVYFTYYFFFRPFLLYSFWNWTFY